MFNFLEQLVTSAWNHFRGRSKTTETNGGKVTVGYCVADEQVTKRRVGLSQARRATHVVIVGKSGTGKSFLLRQVAQGSIG
jgi:ABC-type transport system involved in cytochrome bd biosynthesis fused ATPase/permease subunit